MKISQEDGIVHD